MTEFKSKIYTAEKRIGMLKYKSEEITQNASKRQKIQKTLVKKNKERSEKVQYRTNQGSISR